MIITTHSGNKLDLSDHIHQLIRLGDEHFQSPENEAFIMRLGQCIALAAGPNAPHGILVGLRDRMYPDLWSYTGDLWQQRLNSGTWGWTENLRPDRRKRQRPEVEPDKRERRQTRHG